MDCDVAMDARNEEMIFEECYAVNRLKRFTQKTILAISICLLISGMGWDAAGQQSAPSVAAIESLIRSRQYDQALQTARFALKSKPLDFRLWTLEGIIYSMQGKADDAQAGFGKALRISPQYVPALKGQVQILYQQNDKRAIPLLERILKADASDQTAHEMLAVFERREDSCAQAINHFLASRDTTESHTESLEAYGYCLVQLKKFQDAIPVFQKLVAMLPDRPYPRYDLAVVLVESNQHEDALKSLEPLLTPEQQDPDILSLASQAAEATKDTPKAVALLRQAIVLNSSSQDYYVAFATLCLDHESFQTGIDMINAGLAHIPDAAALYISRGLLYAQLTEYDKAETDFARAGQLDSKQSMSAYAADLAQVQKNDPNEALRRVRVQLKVHPESARLHFLLAQLLVNNDPDPDSEPYRDAMKENLRALELQPDLVIARDLLASMYMRGGRYEETIEQCRTALKYAPDDETATYRLMIALRHTGNKDELPSLVKRLSELHQQSLKNETDRKRFRLELGTLPPQSSHQ
jgi:tetratricopeptide (TPR) repeat protein